MQIGEGIAFGSLVIGFLGFVLKVISDEGSKRSRIYARIDDVKKDTHIKIDETKREIEVKMQSKEICNIHNDRVSADLAEIKADVKLLLKNMK